MNIDTFQDLTYKIIILTKMINNPTYNLSLSTGNQLTGISNLRDTKLMKQIQELIAERLKELKREQIALLS